MSIKLDNMPSGLDRRYIEETNLPVFYTRLDGGVMYREDYVIWLEKTIVGDKLKNSKSIISLIEEHLKSFFRTHKLKGIEVKEFDLEVNNHHIEIVPTTPVIDSHEHSDIDLLIQGIGMTYRINLFFSDRIYKDVHVVDIPNIIN